MDGLAQLAEVLGVKSSPVLEYTNVLNIKIPVIERLNLGQADRLRLASELLAERQISQRGYYARLFAMYSLHPKASYHFSYEQLAELEISEAQQDEIKEKIDKIFKQLDIYKLNQEKQRALMEALFDPRDDNEGDDLKNVTAQEISNEL